MKRYCIFLCAGLLGLCLLLPGGISQADPTSTPTMLPLPTRAYQYLKVTPTPWVVTPSYDYSWIASDQRGEEIADTIINSYRAINVGATPTTGGIVDLIGFMVMAVLSLKVLMSLIRELSGD